MSAPPYRYREALRVSLVLKLAYAALIAVLLYGLVSDEDSTHLVVLGLVALTIIALPLLFGQMLIEVTHDRLSVRYGYARWFGREIPAGNIETTEVVQYRPIRDFGGWGIRCARFDGEWTACYTFRGNRGVLLTLEEPFRFGAVKTRRLLVGSDEPERLKQAMEI